MVPLIVIASGLMIGYILTLMAKEEIRPGKIYFQYLEYIIILALILISLVEKDLLVGLFSLVLMFISYFRLNILFKYLFVSLLFFSEHSNIYIFSLLFMYGFPSAALEKDRIKLFIALCSFIILSSVLGILLK